MNEWDSLAAFLREHRRCGELDGGVDGARAWMSCECGAGLARWLPAKGNPVADRTRLGYSRGAAP